MAAGFAESYIRLWSLKKEKLKGLRSDFSVNNITDRKKHFHTFRIDRNLTCPISFSICIEKAA